MPDEPFDNKQKARIEIRGRVAEREHPHRLEAEAQADGGVNVVLLDE
jgi:hypothetical protein